MMESFAPRKIENLYYHKTCIGSPSSRILACWRNYHITHFILYIFLSLVQNCLPLTLNFPSVELDHKIILNGSVNYRITGPSMNISSPSLSPCYLHMFSPHTLILRTYDFNELKL